MTTDIRPVKSDRVAYGSTPRRDHLAIAERHDREANTAANTLRDRIDGLEKLLGVGIAESVRRPAYVAREAFGECIYAYSAHITQLEDDHRRKADALQAEASDARVTAARAIVLIRELADEIHARRIKSLAPLEERARAFLAELDEPF